MSLSIGEASAVNMLLRYVLNERDLVGNLPTSDQARDAAALLADKARKPLMAGLTGEQVRAAWPDLLLDNGDAVIRSAARAYLHGVDDVPLDRLADALGVPRDDVEALG